MAQKVLKPLRMASAGWGAMGEAGKVTQPWQHRFSNDEAIPREPGPFADNPPVIAPAGTAHMSPGDWGRFLALHASGENGGYDQIIKPDTLKRLHTAPLRGGYMGGWNVQMSSGRRVLNHAGSNSFNYAIAYILPDQELAIGVMTNVGGKAGAMACDNMLNPLQTRFALGALSSPPTRPTTPATPSTKPTSPPVAGDPWAAARSRKVTADFNETPLEDACAAPLEDTGAEKPAEKKYAPPYQSAWTWACGTSIAAPHAAGVAALVIAANAGAIIPDQARTKLTNPPERNPALRWHTSHCISSRHGSDCRRGVIELHA